jgi:hypothetical protein
MAAYVQQTVNLSGLAEPERVEALRVTPEFLSLLGVFPVSGRTFLMEEGCRGSGNVALVSDSLASQIATASQPRAPPFAESGIVGMALFLMPDKTVFVDVVRYPAIESTLTDHVWDLAELLA